MNKQCPTCGYPFDETESELFNNGWVSAKDRLPENGQNIIVYGLHSLDSREEIVVLTYWDRVGLIENITHWMPLPQPPKDK